MRKSTRIVKRLLALFLVVLMSIESFAAVVSDNDGSAFITKAEFDSLKNNFQAQIDQYNTSIDSKIDGSIASYLAGINMAKQKSLDLPITNYNEMKWIRDKFYLYGRYKHFTSKTSYTGPTTNEWYEPYIKEKRLNFRNEVFNIYDHLQIAFIAVDVYLDATVQKWKNGCAQNGARLTENATCAPVLVWYLVKQSNGDYYATTLHNVPVMAPYCVVRPEADHFQKLASHYLYEYAWYGLSFSSLTINTPGANEYLNYTINPVDTRFKFGSSISKDVTDWIGYWQGIGEPDAGESTFNAMSSITSSNLDSDYFTRGGATWNFADSTVWTNYLNPMVNKTMMLGRDSDWEVNVCKYTGKVEGERNICDWSESTEFGSADVKFTVVDISNPFRDDWPGRQAVNVTGTLQFAHFPTYKLKNITNGYFKYNKGLSTLKYGDGLPLVIEAENKGYIQLSFSASVKKINGNGDATDKKNCIFDIKNGSFLSNTSTFVEGYEGHVDPNSTTTVIKQLKDVHINNASGDYEYTIPVNEGDSIWIRLAPYNTDKDIYAKLDNIKIKLITDV